MLVGRAIGLETEEEESEVSYLLRRATGWGSGLCLLRSREVTDANVAAELASRDFGLELCVSYQRLSACSN